MRKLIILLIIAILSTSLANAVWYNPFTWFDNNPEQLGDNITLDNIKYIYENISYQSPIYRLVITEVKATYHDKNDSWSGGYNYTTKVLDGYETKYYTGERIGIKSDTKDYFGIFNLKQDELSEWKVPIGDRNFEEFPSCRTYEIQKGVCNKQILK